MMHFVVIGAQWGDEGKGKIVDYLSEEADLVVRFSGGANAGHTIVTDDITYKLHLVPSGIIYPKTKVVLGTGMVIDPESLFKELDVPLNLKDLGIDASDFEQKMEKLVQYTSEDISSFFSPRPITPAQVEKILRYAYEGKSIDF
jgi:adenylosuccinate synthase